MIKLSEKAFAEASKLPDDDQDAPAQAVLTELASERCWNELFSASACVFGELAEEALAEHRAGHTRLLDPDTL